MWTDNNRNAKIKGDQIEVFKILNGYENMDSSKKSSVNMFKNKIDKYLVKAGYTWNNGRYT